MKFLCICLSPAIDATVRLNVWPTDGCIVKDAVDTFAPGGKAVNVARWLAKRGASVACGGLLGADNAAPFEKELAKYGIEDRFVRVPGATRVNEMFVTPQGSFKVNRACEWKGASSVSFASGRDSPRIAPASQLASLGGYASPFSAEGFDVVVLSGSLPKGWPADTYRHLVAAAKGCGAKVVLDASGKALAEGVEAHPDVIKPNAEECEALVGFVPRTSEEFGKATAALKEFCDYPIISDGANGCWFDGEFVAAPEVDVLDTTAAGDTLLGEWCWSGDTKLAVAAGSAACTMPGGEPPDLALVGRLARNMI